MKTAKKEEPVVKEKKEKVVKPKVTMVSYSIKMVIPTGNYANIQPEIVVNAGTPEEAEAYIAPHMNKLWKEYYMVSERRPVVMTSASPEGIAKDKANKPSPTVQTVTSETVNPPVVKPEEAPMGSVAFVKASQAITSCLSTEALDTITAQVKKSVKLTDEDKDKLMVLIINRIKELKK